MKNNERYPWRTLLYSVAKAFKKLTNPENKPADGVTAFIVDDTIDQRIEYKFEIINHVHDHVHRKTVLGFKILVLTYFDDKSSIPLDFTIHTEKKLERKKTKLQYIKEVDSKSNGGKRRKETGTSKIDQAVVMIKRAAKNGFHADYVLTDAWFTSHAFIKTIREIKNGAMHIIAGIRNDKRQYKYDGQLFSAMRLSQNSRLSAVSIGAGNGTSVITKPLFIMKESGMLGCLCAAIRIKRSGVFLLLRTQHSVLSK